MRTRIFTLVMNKMFIWAPKIIITRKVATGHDLDLLVSLSRILCSYIISCLKRYIRSYGRWHGQSGMYLVLITIVLGVDKHDKFNFMFLEIQLSLPVQRWWRWQGRECGNQIICHTCYLADFLSEWTAWWARLWISWKWTRKDICSPDQCLYRRGWGPRAAH